MSRTARRAAGREERRRRRGASELEALARAVMSFAERSEPPPAVDLAVVSLIATMRDGEPHLVLANTRDDREAARMLAGFAEAPAGWLRVLLLGRHEGRVLAIRWRSDPAELVNARGGEA